jgi:hypothetical protein
MLGEIMEAIYSLLAVWADRLRGSGLGNTKSVFQLILAVVVGLLIGIPVDWALAVFVLLFVAGAAPGWGNPISAFLRDEPMKTDYEFWQLGALRHNAALAVAARGAIWGLPVLAMYPWYPQVLAVAVAYTVAFFGSAWIARKLYPGPCAWGHMEWTRGVLAMLIINAALVASLA